MGPGLHPADPVRGRLPGHLRRSHPDHRQSAGQPGTPFGSETWVSPMDPIFEARVRRETGVAPDYPLGGLTLGVKTIMHSRRIILIAKGEHKAEMVKGPVTEAIPASVLHLHPNCEFLLDKDAAKYVMDLV